MQATELRVDRAVLADVVAVDARIACGGGRVLAIGAAAADAAPRRLAGTLLPGFVDLQVNGAGGRSVDEATDDALDAVARAVWAGGAVAFLPTLITAPLRRLCEQIDAVAAWIERWDGVGAEPLGLHVEGPFLEHAGIHDERAFLDPAPQHVEALLQAARGRLRLLTLASSREGAAAATARLRSAGVAVAIGHTSRAEGFAACVEAGATAVTHLFNAMGSMHHREPGIAGLALDERRVSCSLIVDGEHVHPAMVRNAFRVLGPDRTVLVSDAVAAAGMPDGTYQLGDGRLHARGGVVRDDGGRLAGSALTMARAARNFLQFVPEAGVWTLARVAATNPARLIAAADFGAIAVGRRAAFTLLGDDGTVSCLRLDQETAAT